MQQLSFFDDPQPDWCSDDWRTPTDIAAKMALLVQPHEQIIIDAGAGSGAIARHLPSDRQILAVEKNSLRVEQGACLAPHAQWVCGDYLKCNVHADLIIANPPFSKALAFIAHSLSLLNPNGRILFLLPIDWNCTKTAAKAWKRMNGHIHHVYRIEGRVAYLNRDGVPQKGRQVCDCVFDIRGGKDGAVATYL